MCTNYTSWSETGYFKDTSVFRYAVTFKAVNGGFRILNNGGGRQYYDGRQTSRRIELKFDTEEPYHCTQESECSGSTPMMTIRDDVTKVPKTPNNFAICITGHIFIFSSSQLRPLSFSDHDCLSTARLSEKKT